MRPKAASFGWYQRVIRYFASTRMGAWFFSRAAPGADRLVFRLSGGRTTLASIVSGIPVVMLTTTGARSGSPRTTPVLCVVDQTNPKRFAVIASNFGQKHLPAWYHNLKNTPRALVKMKGQSGVYVAREVSDEEYARYWQAAIDIYPAYQMYRQWAGRHVPIVVLEPEAQKASIKRQAEGITKPST